MMSGPGRVAPDLDGQSRREGGGAVEITPSCPVGIEPGFLFRVLDQLQVQDGNIACA